MGRDLEIDAGELEPELLLPVQLVHGDLFQGVVVADDAPWRTASEPEMVQVAQGRQGLLAGDQVDEAAGGHVAVAGEESRLEGILVEEVQAVLRRRDRIDDGRVVDAHEAFGRMPELIDAVALPRIAAVPAVPHHHRRPDDHERHARSRRMDSASRFDHV